MSFKALAWAFEQDHLSTHSKMILVVLADCHNGDTQRCDPSQQYIAKKSGMTTRAVVNNIEKLEQAGLLTRQRRSHTSNFYLLHVNEVHLDRSLDSERASLNPVNEVHLPSERGAHKPVIEPVIEPKSDIFDEFMRVYPPRDTPHGKKITRTAWDKRIKAGADPYKLVSCAQAFAILVKGSGKEPQFTPMPSTWLNQDRDQDIEPAAPVNLHGGYVV
jgi:biotin operon repressor